MVDPRPSFVEVFSSLVRVRILHRILTQYKKEGRIKEEGVLAAWLVKDCKSDSETIQGHLNFLVRCGLLYSQQFGRVTIYRPRLDNQLVQGIKHLIEFWENPGDVPGKAGSGVA